MGLFLAEILLGFLWWILLLPIFLIISTPFILLFALFDRTAYRDALAGRYASVIEFWKEHGWQLSP